MAPGWLTAHLAPVRTAAPQLVAFSASVIVSHPRKRGARRRLTSRGGSCPSDEASPRPPPCSAAAAPPGASSARRPFTFPFSAQAAVTLRDENVPPKDLCCYAAAADGLADRQDAVAGQAGRRQDAGPDALLRGARGRRAVPERHERQLRGGDVLRLAGGPQERPQGRPRGVRGAPVFRSSARCPPCAPVRPGSGTVPSVACGEPGRWAGGERAKLRLRSPPPLSAVPDATEVRDRWESSRVDTGRRKRLASRARYAEVTWLSGRWHSGRRGNEVAAPAGRYWGGSVRGTAPESLPPAAEPHHCQRGQCGGPCHWRQGRAQRVPSTLRQRAASPLSAPHGRQDSHRRRCWPGSSPASGSFLAWLSVWRRPSSRRHADVRVTTLNPERACFRRVSAQRRGRSWGPRLAGSARGEARVG